MISKITKKIHGASKYLENPYLFTLRQRGVQLETYNNFSQKWMQDLQINVIFDVGANVGHFAITANAAFPQAKIYAFEPIADCFIHLEKVAGKFKNINAFNFGLGEQSEELTFIRNEFSQSSSFLKMTDVHKDAFPFTRSAKEIKVIVKTLDEVAANIPLNEGDCIMLKIDVQGFEDHVIKGGEALIRKAKVIMIETSFDILYEDQPLFPDIYILLQNLGFKYAGSLGQLQDPKNGKLLQQDSLFLKY